MTASYLLSVSWHWQKSSNSCIMLRMCPRVIMTNAKVFTWLGIEGKVFAPFFQSMRAIPTLHVRHEITPSPVSTNVQWPCCNSQAQAFIDLSLVMPWPRHIHILRVLCTAGEQFHCTSCIGNYTSKSDGAGECPWSWKRDSLYYNAVGTVPGAVLACAY